MTLREHVAVRLHGLALRLCPQIAITLHHAIRQQTIAELAAQHHLRQAQLEQHQRDVAERAFRQ